MKKIMVIFIYIVLALVIFTTFPRKYVESYNNGNALYKVGEYEEAIEQYKTALEERIPKYKECNVRINYALAICKTVQLDVQDQESIKSAIKLYENAINILIANGCANKDDDKGHSKTAEQLKKDILEEIDRLKQLLNTENTSTSNEEEQKKNETNVQTIEDKIQDIKQDATKQQRDLEKTYGDFDKEYERVERNW